jgi:hypothetical protein
MIRIGLLWYPVGFAEKGQRAQGGWMRIVHTNAPAWSSRHRACTSTAGFLWKGEVRQSWEDGALLWLAEALEHTLSPRVLLLFQVVRDEMFLKGGGVG